jgi:hypothetical protein
VQLDQSRGLDEQLDELGSQHTLVPFLPAQAGYTTRRHSCPHDVAPMVRRRPLLCLLLHRTSEDRFLLHQSLVVDVLLYVLGHLHEHRGSTVAIPRSLKAGPGRDVGHNHRVQLGKVLSSHCWSASPCLAATHIPQQLLNGGSHEVDAVDGQLPAMRCVTHILTVELLEVSIDTTINLTYLSLYLYLFKVRQLVVSCLVAFKGTVSYL